MIFKKRKFSKQTTKNKLNKITKMFLYNFSFTKYINKIIVKLIPIEKPIDFIVIINPMDIPKIKLNKKFLYLPKTNIAKEIFMKLKKKLTQ